MPSKKKPQTPTSVSHAVGDNIKVNLNNGKVVDDMLEEDAERKTRRSIARAWQRFCGILTIEESLCDSTRAQD
jgi:hypothetical protein